MLTGFLASVWARIAAAGGVVLAAVAGVASVYKAGKRDGELQRRVEDAERTEADRATVAKVDADVAAMGNSDVVRQLHALYDRQPGVPVRDRDNG